MFENKQNNKLAMSVEDLANTVCSDVMAAEATR
jgi:hypothetical protein